MGAIAVTAAVAACVTIVVAVAMHAIASVTIPRIGVATIAAATLVYVSSLVTEIRRSLDKVTLIDNDIARLFDTFP